MRCSVRGGRGSLNSGQIGERVCDTFSHEGAQHMRVLFVHPPHTGFDRNQSPRLTFSLSRIPPLSGITLAAYVRKHGHEPYVIDSNRIALRFGNVRQQTYEEIVRQALKSRPELVAVTMLTADFAECAETIRVLRSALPKARIVGGGPHPSGEPVVTLEQIPELDGIGLGPGEDICLDLANGKPISETPPFLDGVALSECRVIHGQGRRQQRPADVGLNEIHSRGVPAPLYTDNRRECQEFFS